MPANDNKSLADEFRERRLYLATADVSISELLDKAVELLEFVVENHIIKEVAG